LIKLFFKKVFGVKRQRLLSLSAESEIPFGVRKAQEWVNFQPFTVEKRANPRRGFALNNLQKKLTEKRETLRFPLFLHLLTESIRK